MRLTHVTVTNFKSVEDSGEFSIGDVTCLVGKNEAGKTALLQALHRLNPDTGNALFDAQSSYPRRFLSEYEERHAKEEALVLKTVWQLSEREIAGLKEIIGPKGLTGTAVTIYKRYNEKTSTWTVEAMRPRQRSTCSAKVACTRKSGQPSRTSSQSMN